MNWPVRQNIGQRTMEGRITKEEMDRKEELQVELLRVQNRRWLYWTGKRNFKLSSWESRTGDDCIGQERGTSSWAPESPEQEMTVLDRKEELQVELLRVQNRRWLYWTGKRNFELSSWESRTGDDCIGQERGTSSWAPESPEQEMTVLDRKEELQVELLRVQNRRWLYWTGKRNFELRSWESRTGDDCIGQERGT